MMCKTDEKTGNYIISLTHTKLFHRSWENWLCENKLIIDFRGKKTKPNTTEFHSCIITANICENNEK